MAITFVKRSELPAAVKGKVGTLNVAVMGNGQILLSSLATKELDGAKSIVMAFDGATAYIIPGNAPVIIKAKVPEKDQIELRYNKNGGTAAFSGSAILHSMTKYGASHVYDFKASGNQSFPLTPSPKTGGWTFELPEKLAPRPVVTRAKKLKVTAIKAEVSSTSGKPVTEDEILGELA